MISMPMKRIKSLKETAFFYSWRGFVKLTRRVFIIIFHSSHFLASEVVPFSIMKSDYFKFAVWWKLSCLIGPMNSSSSFSFCLSFLLTHFLSFLFFMFFLDGICQREFSSCLKLRKKNSFDNEHHEESNESDVITIITTCLLKDWFMKLSGIFIMEDIALTMLLI